ncbi:hypothetical protein BH23ACT9_BH23ACT9_21810 [soil metagenome]
MPPIGRRRRSWVKHNRHKVVSMALAAPLIAYVLFETIRGL